MTTPKIDPECLGAMSKLLTVVPKLWNDLANKAVVARNTARGKADT